MRHEGQGAGPLDAGVARLGLSELSLTDASGKSGMISWPAQEQALEQASSDPEIRKRDMLIERLSGTLAHWRSWAAEVAARYAAYNPDVARPARRIYVGGLPRKTADVSTTEPV